MIISCPLCPLLYIYHFHLSSIQCQGKDSTISSLHQNRNRIIITLNTTAPLISLSMQSSFSPSQIGSLSPQGRPKPLSSPSNRASLSLTHGTDGIIIPTPSPRVPCTHGGQHPSQPPRDSLLPRMLQPCLFQHPTHSVYISQSSRVLFICYRRPPKKSATLSQFLSNSRLSKVKVEQENILTSSRVIEKQR